MKFLGVVAIAAWFTAVFIAAQAGFFESPTGQPPVAVGLAFAGPLALFLVMFVAWPQFRKGVAGLPTAFLAALHGWRFVGMAFIMAQQHALLPPGFAWPAGIGDMLVAVFAPYLAYRLAREPRFVHDRAFVAWNIIGILDFLMAVGLGVAHQAEPALFHASVGTGLMQELPFVLIPAFFVPLLGMTHVVMLYQSRAKLPVPGIMPSSTDPRLPLAPLVETGA